MLKPFKIDVPQKTLDSIGTRVQAYEWGYEPEDSGWAYGADLAYMKELCRYWVTQYDWRQQEAHLNAFKQFKTVVDGLAIHFIYERGSGSFPTPLLIMHGWPSSMIEHISMVNRLAHPEQFGGDSADAFDVVAVSLPGFGFSDRPVRPMGPRAIAGILHKLMTQNLGYQSYMAQGGDWGSAISSWLGYDHAPACCAIHINFPTMRHFAGPQTPEETQWAEALARDQVMELKDGDLGSVYTKDVLLTNIMIYLVTGSFNSATWIYFGRREEGGRILSQEGRRVEVPTAVAVFPAEMMAWPPRTYVDRLYRVARWTEMPKGGHFPAMEQPQLLADDVRAFARSLRAA